MTMFELKPLSQAAIPAALAKAERYRLLGEPEQSQSICEDVLSADDSNQTARVMLILALSDQFALHHPQAVGRAVELAASLETQYDREYYGGLVAERRGRALLEAPGISARAAIDWLQEAMQAYDRADALRPADNDEARLRWNACARTLNALPSFAFEDERRDPVMNE